MSGVANRCEQRKSAVVFLAGRLSKQMNQRTIFTPTLRETKTQGRTQVDKKVIVNKIEHAQCKCGCKDANKISVLRRSLGGV